MYPTHTKIFNSTIGDDQIDSNFIFDTLNGNVNSGSAEKDTHVPDLCALEQLARNAYQEAEKQQILSKKVQKQNNTLTSQLELYKKRVRVMENINEDNNYLNEFLKDDQRVKHFDQQAQSQFISDRDIIRDLEKQRDKLELVVNDYKRKHEEFQETHFILKKQMSEKEDSFHDTIIDLEEKLKKNVDLILKLGNSLQGMFMLRPKPLFVYEQHLKHSFGYSNPYTLKQVISQYLKLYLASSLGNSEILLNVRDNQDTLDDASKSQQKVKEKMNDPIVVVNKQNMNATSSVRRSMNRDSHDKNSVLANSKNLAKKVAVYVRKNKQTDNTFTNVISNKENVIDVDVANIVDSGCSKYMTGDRSLLRNFIEKFMGTVRSGNDNFAAITCYGDYIQGNITICHVYYVECLGHNLFSVRQFCDGDLEVAFRSKTCYVRNLEGDDLLIGGRESNLYTISIFDMAASSPVCMMSKETLTKPWLWHRRLSHLNFGTINDLTRLDLVNGFPKFKYEKDHLCSTCERGKSKKDSHPPKLVPSDNSKLELLHMDLCGPIRVASINGKKYILVIVDDYSRYTWVYFLHSEDETPEIIKKFIDQAQLNYKAKVCKIHTDNASEHDYLEPELQRFNNHNSSAETMNTPSKEDLDNLFGPMFEEYFGKKSSKTPINYVGQPIKFHEDSPSTSSISVEEHKAPTIETTSDETRG
nr:integrase, catalytic region, zinc finger, CCHC-type, peptidase aspartic, catalytic [Tanacetum cinerariifolium]